MQSTLKEYNSLKIIFTVKVFNVNKTLYKFYKLFKIINNLYINKNNNVQSATFTEDNLKI